MDSHLFDYEYRAQQLRAAAEHERLLNQLPERETLFQTVRKAVKDLFNSEV